MIRVGWEWPLHGVWWGGWVWVEGGLALPWTEESVRLDCGDGRSEDYVSGNGYLAGGA